MIKEFLGYWFAAMCFVALIVSVVWIGNAVRLIIGDNWAAFLLVSFVFGCVMYGLRNQGRE